MIYEFKIRIINKKYIHLCQYWHRFYILEIKNETIFRFVVFLVLRRGFEPLNAWMRTMCVDRFTNGA